jgi:hypothetical protein
MTFSHLKAMRHCSYLLSCLFVFVFSYLLSSPPPALAAGEGPGWELTAHTTPTYLPPGVKGAIRVEIFNVGARASEGPITVTDTLPNGVSAVEAGGVAPGVGQFPYLPRIEQTQWSCTGGGGGPVAGATVITCTNLFAHFAGGGGPPTGDQEAPESPRVAIVVEGKEEITPAQAARDPNRVTVAGGGAPVPASASDPIPVTREKPGFGFAGWDGWFSNADGTLDTQAGSHPYEATFTLNLNSVLSGGEELAAHPAGREARDFEVRLPPGLVIDPNAVPQCTRARLAQEECPKESQVGIITVNLGEEFPIGFALFNIVPPPGVPGEFGFNFSGTETLLQGSVRSGSDYGITVHGNAIPDRRVLKAIVTLWDVPGEEPQPVAQW